MICTLNKTQKEATLKLVSRIVHVNKVDSPEKILQNVYHAVFESFTKKNMQKEAQPYALAMTQYAADNLYLLLDTEDEGLRELMAKVAGTEHQFSIENIEKFKKEEELKKLLGIKETTIESLPSSVSKTDVQRYLDKIALKFPPISQRITYIGESYPYTEWTFPIAKDSQGKDIKLPSVTDFLKLTKTKNVVASDNLITRSGVLVDVTIRKFFANPVSYDKFIENMLKDKEFAEAFKRFSENTSLPTTEATSPTAMRYMEEYLKDMMYAINFIQSNYQDSYVTDLGTLVNQSSLTPEEKRKFYIYSAEVGLRGEIDLIAIKPDGTYTIIDIKTTDGYHTKAKESQHAKQASIYDLIMSKVSGLKSSGVNEIVYLTRFITNPTQIMGNKVETGNYKLAISAYSKQTNQNIPSDDLMKEIDLYKANVIDKTYQRSTPTSDSNQEVKPFSAFSPINMIRAGRKKPGEPLKQIFDPNEELATAEDLKSGQRWLVDRFPELEGKVQIQRTINSESGAEFFLDTIIFWEKSNKGAAYHEGWHRFSQLYMTKKEKTALYESVQKDAINFKTRDGRKLNTSTADYMQVEEFLAEEFRKYATNPDTYTFPKGNPLPKSWFQKIWEALKSIALFWKQRGATAYEEMFKELYTNTFSRSHYSVRNAMFTHLNSFFVDSVTGKDTLLDNITFLRFRDFSDFNLSEYMKGFDLTISDLTTSVGIRELHQVILDSLLAQREQIVNSRSQIAKEMNEAVDEGIMERLKANDDNLKFYQDTLDLILEKNAEGQYVRFPDYINAYFRTSTFESLRQFVSKNRDRVNRIITEENLNVIEKEEEEGEDLSDLDEGEEGNVAKELEYDRVGNEKEAIALAKAILKDFFNAFPRHKNSDLITETHPSIFEVDKGGLPVTLSKQEAFYKTLRVLQGSLTWDNIIQRLNNPSNYLIFPELLTVKEKLLGKIGSDNNPGNEGLVPKLQRLSKLLMDGTATESDIVEHTKLMSFLMNFAHVMSLRNVTFETFVVKLNYDPQDDYVRTINPLQTRENLESIIYSIINDFSKGFQLNMEKKFMASASKKYINVHEALYDIFGKGEKGLADFMTTFGSKEFIYDPQYKKFFFNSLYLFKKFDTSNPSDREMKDFFGYLGITLNDKIYDNENDRKELLGIYNKLKEIIYSFHRNTGDKIVNLYNTSKITNAVNTWKAAKDRTLIPNQTIEEQVLANKALADAETDMNGFVNLIFTGNPVEQMLFDGRDRNLMKGDKRNRIFAANLPTFQQLARIEKNYHKRFSSGSMLVLDKLQFSYFLPNNMLLTEMLVNEHVNSTAEFNKYPELAHLDPVQNPSILNSWAFSTIFSQEGGKKPNMRLGVSNISQLSIISDDEIVESKRMQDTKEDEKMLFDFLMGESEGSTEIRRLETSNTAYRLSVQNVEGNNKHFIKPVKIQRNEGFTNPTFLSIVRGYIQHAAWKYLYNQNPANRELDVEYAKMGEKGKTDRRDTLGVFDEMLPLAAPKIKTFIAENAKILSGDMNALMAAIEQIDEDLFQQINKEIATYFENVAIKNEDSYKNVFNDKLSEKGKSILAKLSSINATGNFLHMGMDMTGNVSEHLFRDFIANDFIMTMEDAILFFGDYTYYKDPIKRRKIIGNNGSINIIDGVMTEAIAAQKKSNSINEIYQQSKGIVSDKNNKLVRKLVVQDVKMTSSLLKKDKDGVERMLKDLQQLRKEKFGQDISIEQLREEKKETIEAFTDMEVGDAAAWISLDTYRQMRMREQTWDIDRDEKEYKRQQYIMMAHLNQELTQEQKDFVNNGPYSGLNVAKFAMTGPVYNPHNMPFKPGFDKMGLRVMLPEFDWNRTTRPVFEDMMAKDMDYVVFDTGSKVYRPPVSKVFADNGLVNVYDGESATYAEHAGGYFKYQQNTTQLTDKSTFSVQLRGIFYEIMLVQKKYGSVSPNLKSAYNKMIKSLSDYITINSSRALTEMGLDINGKIRDRFTFVNYLKERLNDIGGVDNDLVDLLNANLNGDLSTYLEALPFQKNIIDLIAGVVDDNFRKVKLNGTKFYQSPEIGTAIHIAKRPEDIPEEFRGTMELKWHGLEIVNGKIISTLPVECRINFREQFYPLLKLKHPDGARIDTLKRLNEAIKNPEWVKSNKDSITFVGVRIPLQDINFSSHIIIREFLPETVGDMIILPPEFYKQTGSDNDIDTVTATFKWLDPSTGRTLKRPTEDFNEIVDRINELSTQTTGPINVVDNFNMQDELDAIKQKFKEENVYISKGASMDVLDRELRIVEEEGYLDVEGLKSSNSILQKLIKRGEFNELTDELMDFINKINDTGKGKIKSESKKELNTLRRKKANYTKGVTNDIVTSIIEFMAMPENFDFLTETDSITKIKEMAAENIARKTGRKAEDISLAAQQSSLQAMSYVMNIVNHRNNFQIRSILGSVVKFRSIMSLLDKLDTTLQKQYLGGSMINLLSKKDNTQDLVKIIEKRISDKTYGRNIYTPLLYKKDTSKGIAISVFDEDGVRMTKNLSMLVSSLLDLFKNMDVFPSLGISWLNVKPLLFLMAQGVPMERAIMFLNNPVVQDVQKELDNLGSDAKDRHALVSSVQKYSGSEIFGIPSSTPIEGDLSNREVFSESVFSVKVTTASGQKDKINPMMRRPGKAAERYLGGKYLKFSEDELIKFTEDYAVFIADPARIKQTRTLSAFLNANKQYQAVAKDIAAYYGTLLEDGDIFYAYFVKGLNRNSAKMNSNSAVASAKAVKKARQTTGMANPEFEQRLENESPHSPFFKDNVIQNVLANAMPQILDNPDIYFRTKFREMLEKITSSTFGTTEDKRDVEMRVLSDFIEFVYKNFYIYKEGSKGNTLYEYFEYDITPLLGPLMKDSDSYKKFLDSFTRDKEAGLSEDTKIKTLFSDSLFANQIEMLRAKYPELRAIKIVDELLSKKEHGKDPHKETNLEFKDILNLLSQSYITLNLSSNPKDKEAEETIIRDDWKKMINFSLSQFPSVEAEVGQNVDRIDFYKNVDNIFEIRRFFRLLAYYSLAQSSHVTKTRASFSHLAPPEIIKSVVEEGINNFNKYIQTAGTMFTNLGTGNEETRKKAIDSMLDKFEKMFRDMNGEIKWQNAQGTKTKQIIAPTIEEGDDLWGSEDMILGSRGRPKEGKGMPYLKAHTGKIYSKIEDNTMLHFRNQLVREQDITVQAHNDFKIQIFTNEGDPLNCSL